MQEEYDWKHYGNARHHPRSTMPHDERYLSTNRYRMVIWEYMKNKKVSGNALIIECQANTRKEGQDMANHNEYEFFKESFIVSEIELLGTGVIISTSVNWIDDVYDERMYHMHHEFRSKKLEEVNRIHGHESKEYDDTFEPRDKDGIITSTKKKEFRIPMMSDTGYRSHFTSYHTEDPRKWSEKDWWKHLRQYTLAESFGDGYEGKAKVYEDLGVVIFKPVKMTFNNVEVC